jgi:hypothetical protein
MRTVPANELASTVPQDSKPSGLRTSWPLFNLSFPRALLPQRIHSPLRKQVTLERGIASEQTMDTPSPRRRGFLASFFSKRDDDGKSPSGPMYTKPFDEGQGSRIERERRCCGLPYRILIFLLIVLMIIALVATITPILILRNRQSAAAGSTISQCEVDFPCQHGGASVLVNTPPQCACLCAGGFSGAQCQTFDSSCVIFSSDNVQNKSIGSAIAPLIQVAQADFSNQFTLSAEKIIEQFAARNVSCTSQNSLVNLNGSDSVDLTNSGPAVGVNKGISIFIFEAWTTTTSTTTTTETFTSTISFTTASKSSSWTTYSTLERTNTITSVIPSSTFSIATSTVSPGPNATPISSQDLVFGRCVILAVVQDFGVAEAAAIQHELEAAIVAGDSVVQDSGSGLVIDLSGQVVSGLPQNG